ncbi:MAG: hypothetical protein KDA41_18990 [Planctomycetales bacterium]|nr:hypothetical protein [Planctomycetales bacterium]
MFAARHRILLFVLAIALPFFSGCCCTCRLPVSGLKPVVNPPGGGAVAETDGSDNAVDVGGDPATPEEIKTAREYAQQALSNKRYGSVNTARLRKDGSNWYVSGTAGGKEGGTVNYEIWFTVMHFEGGLVRWNVQTVTVDGEVVYP